MMQHIATTDLGMSCVVDAFAVVGWFVGFYCVLCCGILSCGFLSIWKCLMRVTFTSVAIRGACLRGAPSQMCLSNRVLCLFT